MKDCLRFGLFAVSSLMLWACSKDAAEPIPAISVEDFSVTIDENPASGQLLGAVIASSDKLPLTFTISEQNPSGALAIDSNTGELMVSDSAAYDFEINPVITGSVSASNGITSDTGSITIMLNDVDETPAMTIWSGDKITFTKTEGADPNEEANQDRITENVWITRGNQGGQIFNIKQESSAARDSSPVDTEWAQGTFAELPGLTFKPFRAAVLSPQDVVGKELVLHLITDDVYLEVKFVSWSVGKLGGFSYERSTE